MNAFRLIVLGTVVCYCLASCITHNEAIIKRNNGARISNLSEFANLPRQINDNGKEVHTDELAQQDRYMLNFGIFYLPIPNATSPATSIRIASWQEADTKIDAFLKQNESSPWLRHYRQKCALDILCLTNLMTDRSKASLPIIEKYLSMLATDNNGSVVVYYTALKALKNHAFPAWRRQIATIAIQEGENLINTSKADRVKYSIKGEWEAMFVKGEEEYTKYVDLLRNDHLLAVH